MEKFSVKKRAKSFEYAARGFVFAVRTQHNIWIHLAATLAIVVAGIHYKLSSAEWCLIIICIGIVLSAEIINSAIEGLTDMVSPEYDTFAGKVKDMAAGAVLCASIAAAIVGCIIFIPKIF